MNLFPRSVLPVLMYHRFGTPAGGDPNLWIPIEVFATQLAWLGTSGFRTLSLDEAHEALVRRSISPADISRGLHLIPPLAPP